MVDALPFGVMFTRLAESYRGVVQDLVLSLQARALSLRDQGHPATSYVYGNRLGGRGASFVADLGNGHVVRFLVSDFGISWVESRNGRELVRLEGAEAIEELQHIAALLKSERLNSTTASKAQPAPARRLEHPGAGLRAA